MSNEALKIILIGEAEVGKTSIRNRYVMSEEFKETYVPTFGADYSTHEITMEKEKTKTVVMRIWDIAGQSHYKFIRKKFLNNANGILFVFDITNISSFEALDEWMDDVDNSNPNQKVPFVIVGNKLDLDEIRTVSKEDVIEYINTLKQKNNRFIEYIEASALKDVNINESFDLILNAIV